MHEALAADATPPQSIAFSQVEPTSPGGYTTSAWGPASIRPKLHALCILWDQAEACLNTSILSFLLNTILLPSSLSSKETQNKLLK